MRLRRCRHYAITPVTAAITLRSMLPTIRFRYALSAFSRHYAAAMLPPRHADFRHATLMRWNKAARHTLRHVMRIHAAVAAIYASLRHC